MPIVYILSLAASALQGQNGVITTEATWPTKPKIFMIWSSTEKFANLYTRLKLGLDWKYKGSLDCNFK